MSITNQGNSFLKSTPKSASRVGKDVLCYCSRCKLNLSHTIVSLTTGNKPDRVLCNTCKTERSYRAPKSESELAQIKSQGESMSERDDDVGEVEIDVAKVLLGETGVKKKPKAKAKAKKKDDAEPKMTAKLAATLPLSMQPAAAEDVAMFDSKFAALRGNTGNAKEYKATVRLNAGEIINHKSFGIGFVVAESGLNKIEVLFKAGRKLLVTAPAAKA